MRSANIIVIVFIFLTLHVQPFFGQINVRLAEICDSIKTVDDNSDPNYSQLRRSRTYDIRFENDSLKVYKWERNCLSLSDGGEECRTDSIWHQIAVRDIGKIHYECKIKGAEIYPFLEGRLEINALRDYNLVQRKYADGTIRQTWYIPLNVINFQDTIHFKALAKLLNDHINTQSNYIEPNCAVEKLELYSLQKRVSAIENSNLHQGITLNGNTDVEAELEEVLLPYLKAQNIPKLYGDIIVDETDKYQHFICEQNNMFNYLQTLDTIPSAYAIMKKTAYFEITDEQRQNIASILARQKWTSGRCNDNKVVSYVIFHVANNEYKKVKK